MVIIISPDNSELVLQIMVFFEWDCYIVVLYKSVKEQIDKQIVYALRTQKLKFIAPMPEQIGIPAMHFYEFHLGQ